MTSSGDDSAVNLEDDKDVDSNCDDSGSERDNEHAVDDEHPGSFSTPPGHKKIVDLTADDICGLTFGRLEEAYKFYCAYAKMHGFVVRKDVRRKTIKGEINVQQYVCNREGWRNKKHFLRVDRKMDHRPLTRTGCGAKLRLSFDYKTSCWNVVSFKERHNHELTPASLAPYVPANRVMSDGDKAQADSLHSHGVRTCHIMGYMLAQKGGYAGLTFLKEDLYNYFNRQNREKIKDGDARNSLTYLQGKADNDPMFFSKYTTTDDGRLKNLFWADSRSITDFQCFGDVLAFDTTYNKNKYKLPLVIFCGSNHHSQTVIFGCALVVDETIETYKWVLQTFLEAMRNKHPTAVVTDEDKAMRAAIKQIFPNATHRLCGWHLNQIAGRKIKNASFVEDFKKALYANFSIDEFEEFWKDMVVKHGLVENKWVCKTYEKKTMWANAYLRDQFFAGIRTTSRCEGINSYIKLYVGRKNSIVDMLHNMEAALRGYRANEQHADYDSRFKEPYLLTSLHKFEREASKIFTLEIFREIRYEIGQVGSLIIMERIENGDTLTYKICSHGKPNSFIGVVYDTVNSSFSCDCRLFHSRGIPCCHIFCAMTREHIESIPSSLICKRWTKYVKSEFITSDQLDEMDPDVTKVARRGAAAAACNRLCEIASQNGKNFNEIINAILKLTSKYDKGSSTTQGDTFNDILDPTTVNTKGAPSKKRNRAPSKNPYSKTRRRCSNCRKTGHISRTCPTRLDTEDEHIVHDVSSPPDDDDMRRQVDEDKEDTTTFNDHNVQQNDHSTRHSNDAEIDKEGATFNEGNVKHNDTKSIRKKGKEKKESKVNLSTQNSINDSDKQGATFNEGNVKHNDTKSIRKKGKETKESKVNLSTQNSINDSGKQPSGSARRPHPQAPKVQHIGHTTQHIGKQAIDFSNKGSPEITHHVLLAPPLPPENVSFSYDTSNLHLTSSHGYDTSSKPHNLPSDYGALSEGMPMPPLPYGYSVLSQGMPTPPLHGVVPSYPQFSQFPTVTHMPQYLGGVQSLNGGTSFSNLVQEVVKKGSGSNNKDEASSSKEQEKVNKKDGEK